jgi:hypothetical protein
MIKEEVASASSGHCCQRVRWVDTAFGAPLEKLGVPVVVIVHVTVDDNKTRAWSARYSDVREWPAVPPRVDLRLLG